MIIPRYPRLRGITEPLVLAVMWQSRQLQSNYIGLPTLFYQQRRLGAAHELGIRVSILDKLVRDARAVAEEADSTLPHWNVEPWDAEVPGAKLLDDIEKEFRRYIVLPEGAGEALALWTLHAWTADAGDISPFLASRRRSAAARRIHSSSCAI